MSRCRHDDREELSAHIRREARISHCPQRLIDVHVVTPCSRRKPIRLHPGSRFGGPHLRPRDAWRICQEIWRSSPREPGLRLGATYIRTVKAVNFPLPFQRHLCHTFLNIWLWFSAVFRYLGPPRNSPNRKCNFYVNILLMMKKRTESTPEEGFCFFHSSIYVI